MQQVIDKMISWVITHPNETKIKCREENIPALRWLVDASDTMECVYGFRLYLQQPNEAFISWTNRDKSALSELKGLYEYLSAKPLEKYNGIEPKNFVSIQDMRKFVDEIYNKGCMDCTMTCPALMQLEEIKNLINN